MREKSQSHSTPTLVESELALLSQLATDFARSLNIEETLQEITTRFMSYLGAEAASVFLLDKGASSLVCAECIGPVDIKGMRLGDKEGVVGQCVQTREPIIVDDVSSYHKFFKSADEMSGFETKSILCVPLFIGEDILGALELLNKNEGRDFFNHKDVRMATIISTPAALALKNSKLAAQLIDQERMARELELAGEIQKNFLPAKENSGFPIHAINIPAREVSGDFFDFFRMEDGRIYFALADVSGKGMNAALLMAKTISLLRCLAKEFDGPGDVLRRVNEELCETATMGMFVTVIVGYLTPETGHIEIANAGHPPALYKQAQQGVRLFGATAPPLGIMPDTDYPSSEFFLDGGLFYLYSDGLSESKNNEESMFGCSGLMDLVNAVDHVQRDERIDTMVKRWKSMGYVSNDDVTLLVVDLDNLG